MSIKNILGLKRSSKCYNIDFEKNILIINDGVICLEPELLKDIPYGSVFNEVRFPSSLRIIGSKAFEGISFKKLVIPEGVVNIHNDAFRDMSVTEEVELPSTLVEIGDFAMSNINRAILKKFIVKNPHLRLLNPFSFRRLECEMIQKNRTYYKAFRISQFGNFMRCRDFIYEEGKTYEMPCKPKCCLQGFHFCNTPLDCFRYYIGDYDFPTDNCYNVVIHEVSVLGDTDHDTFYDDKGCTNKIKIGRRLTLQECFDKSIEYWQKQKKEFENQAKKQLGVSVNFN